MSRAYFLHMQVHGALALSALEFSRVRPADVELSEREDGSLIEVPVWVDPISGDRTEGAKQAFAAECDINKIVQRFDRDGVLTHLSNRVGHFMDVSAFGDFQSVMEQIGRASEFFTNELPASVREKFGNDPAAFLDALADPSRRELLEELGILEKEKPPEAPAPPAAPPTQ